MELKFRQNPSSLTTDDKIACLKSYGQSLGIPSMGCFIGGLAVYGRAVSLQYSSFVSSVAFVGGGIASLIITYNCLSYKSFVKPFIHLDTPLGDFTRTMSQNCLSPYHEFNYEK